MNKLVKTLATVSMAAALTLSAVPFSASAEESTEPASEQTNEDPDISSETISEPLWFVTAQGDDYVLVEEFGQISECYLSQSTYKARSGNTNTLKCGDVLDIDCGMILETWPGKFDGITSIKYLGTVSEVYKDSLKDLTVTKKDKVGIMELKDSSGQVYKWHEYSYVLEEQGLTSDIDPRKIHTGDVLECAVEQRERINYGLQSRPKEMVWEVVMPTKIVSQVNFVPSGDANGDGKTDARDCAYIASLLAKANYNKYNLTDDADYNKDGKKDIRDAAALSRALAKKK